MSYTLDQLVQEARKLPPIPQTAQKVLTLIRDPESNAAGLARVIETDQVLTARMLHWANSAQYGMGSQIVTVQQAVTILGMKTVQELVLSYSLSDTFNRPVPGYKLQRGELWQHALGTAICAKLISKQRQLKIEDEAYMAGLLCDIGKLIFEKLLCGFDLTQVEWGQSSFLDLERASFGFDHAFLGAEIARRWQLPENLVEAIACHHDPQAAKVHPRLVGVVHVADMTMMILGVGVGIDGLRYPLDGETMKSLGMSEEDLFYLVEAVTEQLAEAKWLFDPA